MRNPTSVVIEESKRPSVSRPRSLPKFAQPLEQIAAESLSLIPSHQRIKDGADSSWLLRYLFVGPQGGGKPIRIAIFAGIHGDRPDGAHAVVRLIRLLEAHPELARGYVLSLYPVCNPTGFEDNTHHSRRGKDLNREFWNNSVEPEILVLQKELFSHTFAGIVSLNTADTNLGFYGVVRGANLTEALINPALAAAEDFLPRDPRTNIDGVASNDGVVRESSPNILSAHPKVRPRPFEITLEAPTNAPTFLKECAFVAALQAILVEYPKFPRLRDQSLGLSLALSASETRLARTRGYQTQLQGSHRTRGRISELEKSK